MIIRGRLVGILLFSIQIFILVINLIYGRFKSLKDDDVVNFATFIMLSCLTILGYGLIISYQARAIEMGMIITLLVTSLSVQLGPICQHLWYKVLGPLQSALYSADVKQFYETSFIISSLYSERLAMICSCSLLVSFTGFAGKLGLIEIVIVTIIFNFGWALAFFALTVLQSTSESVSLYVFDNYGTNFVYLFGSTFGGVLCLFLSKVQTPSAEKNSLSYTSGLLSILGTAVVFATFPFTGILFPYFKPNRFVTTQSDATIALRFMQGPINLYFSLAASVVAVYAAMACFRKTKINKNQLLLSTISGGIVSASFSSVLNSLGISIAIGLWAGILSVVWQNIIEPRINKNQLIDNLGMLGSIWLNSFCSAILFAPMVYFFLKNQATTTIELVQYSSLATDQLVAAGVVLAVAGVCGVISGGLTVYLREAEHDFDSAKILSRPDEEKEIVHKFQEIIKKEQEGMLKMIIGTKRTEIHQSGKERNRND